jgi:Iron-sulfur cluster-binding domain
LGIGNVLQANLLEIWRSEPLKQLRASFGTSSLNKTCAGCDMYRDLEFYRTGDGRRRARMNRERHLGLVQIASAGQIRPFTGG